MHSLCERTRSHNPTLWVVTTTGDQHCRKLHGMSKCERNSGLRALPAHAPALKAAREVRRKGHGEEEEEKREEREGGS